ncbi:hypothetical protein N8517_02280 [Synechococcus sp. AH-601-L23]|nr:hypothetical protein [Synechococcus sp. AH-601-L23]MDB4638616.1 hypothetical protein [bacterium]
MSQSSPYATFQADAWMRQSLIRPRKLFAASVVPQSKRSRGLPRHRPSQAVQGELFLFPVVLPC